MTSIPKLDNPTKKPYDSSLKSDNISKEVALSKRPDAKSSKTDEMARKPEDLLPPFKKNLKKPLQSILHAILEAMISKSASPSWPYED